VIDLAGAVIGFVLMLLLMGLGFHIAFVMFAISIIGALVYLGMPAVLAFGNQFWGATNNFVLVAIPLFVLLGEILVRGGFTDRMYRALSDWLSPLPGGLLHTNIGASAMFAAVSGSSVATAATIGTVALPAFRNRNYDERLVLGTIAAGATLGILIPPSINMIIYGAMTNTSVGQLYAAGVIPGLLLTGLFSLVVIVLCTVRPSLAGERIAAVPIGQRLRRLVDLLPPLVIFGLVMGSIYLGWATPTESAALGVVVALALATGARTLSVSMLNECFVSTVAVTAMIMLIAAAAFYLNFVLGIMGVPQSLSSLVKSLDAGPLELLAVLTIFYLVLGCFLDALAMVIGTIPIVMPIILAAGIDPVWFGIYLVVMAELALITPPVGMNLYVVQGIRGRGLITDVIVGTLPFLAMMLLLVVLLVVWPGIALWLPRQFFG
jgi:tripartite ATP-independent transporter DctM subunit